MIRRFAFARPNWLKAGVTGRAVSREERLAGLFKIWFVLGELFPPSVLGKVFGFYNMTCFIGGVLGPYLTGVIHDATGSFAAGLYAAAVGCLVSALLAMAVRPAWRLAPVPALVTPGSP